METLKNGFLSVDCDICSQLFWKEREPPDLNGIL